MEIMAKIEVHENKEIEDKVKEVVVIKDVRVRYSKDAPIVLQIEKLVINRGERVAIIGPSGAGKTTFLRLINGFIHPETGCIEILGYKSFSSSTRPRNLGRRIGFIFQHFNLIDRATVFENVLWGSLGRVNPFLSILGWFPDEARRAAMDAISEVNLLPQASQRTDTLSGGQLQRVAIARVLAQEPEIILADEPVSNLDPALSDEILGLLVEVSQRHGVTLIMNVHQPALAKCYADRIIGLKEGRVVFDERASQINVMDLRFLYEPEVNGSLVFNSNSKH
jgi:phosphonate transport system ATP-binding protein